MHFGIFPTVTEIGFKRIETYESTFIDQAITFRWFLIVLMNLGQAIGEIKLLVVDGMRKW